MWQVLRANKQLYNQYLNGWLVCSMPLHILLLCFSLIFSFPVNAFSSADRYPSFNDNQEWNFTESIRDSEVLEKHRFLFFSIETLENSRQYLGSKLNAISTGMDLFFVDSFFNDDDFEPHVNKSKMRISLQSFQEKGKKGSYSLDVKGTLSLPHTENKIKLLFESEEDDIEAAERVGSPIEAVNSQGYQAAFRFLLDASKTWDIDFDTGIKLRTPLEPFVRLRGRRQVHFIDWDMRFLQTFYWFQSIGAGETSRLEFIRNIGYDKWLSINTELNYRLDNAYFTFRHVYSLYHELTERSASAFRIGIKGNNEDRFKSSEYFIDWRYRRRAYDDWLFWEVKPQITFPEKRHFEVTPGILFKVEMLVNG